MGEDERECTDECPFESKCNKKFNMTCIQHRSADKICRCAKDGYRPTTQSLSYNTKICQG